VFGGLGFVARVLRSCCRCDWVSSLDQWRATVAVYSKLANGEYAHAALRSCLASRITAQYLLEAVRHLPALRLRFQSGKKTNSAHDARLRSQDANKRRQRFRHRHKILGTIHNLSRYTV